MTSLRGRIAGELRERISSGQLKPGDFLPTERELAENYGVNAGTIKRATAELVYAGLIERVPGRGGGMRVRENFVITHYASRAELPDVVSESDTFFREVREQGFTPSQDFTVLIEAMPTDIAKALGVDPGSNAVVRRCVRMVNGHPTSIQDSYYPHWLTELVPDLTTPRDIPIGTTQLLTQKGFKQVAFVDVEHSRMPTAEEFSLLKMQPGTSVLEWRRIGYSRERPIRVSLHIMSGPTARVVHTVGDPGVLRRLAVTFE